jgi:hypothetical protein
MAKIKLGNQIRALLKGNFLKIDLKNYNMSSPVATVSKVDECRLYSHENKLFYTFNNVTSTHLYFQRCTLFQG